MTSPVQLSHVTRRYSASDQPAIADLSLDLHEHEILALVGESGCGKTTLLRLIAGLERPDQGTVILRQQRVADETVWVPPEKRSVGLVFQEGALFPHLTVTGNITYGLKGRGPEIIRTRVAEMLDLIGLEGLANRYPHELSGGERQRLALARALAPEPDVLLLDEPFSNLDISLRRSLREDVRRILSTVGTPSIFVVHDPDDALTIGDRVAVLHAGRLQQIDTPFMTYHNPCSGYVAKLFGPANPLPRPDGTMLWIRPEHVRIVSNRVEPSVEGRIQEIRETGIHRELQIQLQGFDDIHWILWDRCQKSLKLGDQVRLNYDLPNTYSLP